MAAYRLRSFSERESWNIRIECSSSGLYIMAGRPLRGLDCPCYGYTAWAGDREVIESAILNGQTNPSVPVANLTAAITALAGAGGRTFIVQNLPELGMVPASQGFPQAQR